jgi:hypothetical protein
VKLAITDAMQAGTLSELVQFGGPGGAGLVKLGFTPKTLPGPKEKPLLLLEPVLFPATLYPEF